MKLRKWLGSAVRFAMVVGALSACGDDTEEPGGDGNSDKGMQDAQVGDGGMDANVNIPDPGKLPDIPVDDPTSGAPPGAQFFKKQNPLIYLNDWPDSVYTDAYVYALASNGDAKVVGVISSGIDCKCGAGDNLDPSPRRQEWIDAAREAGFVNVPNNTSGGFGLAMAKPASGVITETVRQPTPGSALIVEQAKRATKEVPLVILSGGPITPLADAFLQDPTITQTIVVSWIAGTLKPNVTPAELTLTTNYMVGDPWAAEIVLKNFRVFVFPIDVDPPIVPECRIASDLPDSQLRNLLFNAGYFQPGRDGDGAAAVTVNFPAYMKKYTRLALTTGLETENNVNGNIWMLTEGDAAGGGEEWFKELRKAYKLPATGPAVNSDAGCAP
jgi:hypothetical protein